MLFACSHRLSWDEHAHTNLPTAATSGLSLLARSTEGGLFSLGREQTLLTAPSHCFCMPATRSADGNVRLVVHPGAGERVTCCRYLSYDSNRPGVQPHSEVEVQLRQAALDSLELQQVAVSHPAIHIIRSPKNAAFRRILDANPEIRRGGYETLIIDLKHEVKISVIERVVKAVHAEARGLSEDPSAYRPTWE